MKNLDNILVVIDFYADWCAPCKLMSPIVDSLSRKFKNKIKFVKINVEKEESIAKKYNVMSLPTFLLLDDGVELERFSGSISKESFNDILIRYL